MICVKGKCWISNHVFNEHIHKSQDSIQTMS